MVLPQKKIRLALFLVFKALHFRGPVNFIRRHVSGLEAERLAAIREMLVIGDVEMPAFETVDLFHLRENTVSV